MSFYMIGFLLIISCHGGFFDIWDEFSMNITLAENEIKDITVDSNTQSIKIVSINQIPFEINYYDYMTRDIAPCIGTVCEYGRLRFLTIENLSDDNMNYVTINGHVEHAGREIVIGLVGIFIFMLIVIGCAILCEIRNENIQTPVSDVHVQMQDTVNLDTQETSDDSDDELLRTI